MSISRRGETGWVNDQVGLGRLLLGSYIYVPSHSDGGPALLLSSPCRADGQRSTPAKTGM